MGVLNKITNPFVLGYNIPNEYFCDRTEETDKIINLLLNKNNVVLMSERRIGKSSLLTHILKDKRISEDFTTIYVDIYKTENAEQFSAVLAESLMKAGLRFPKSLSQNIQALLSKFSLDYGFDAYNKPSLSFHLNPVQASKPDYSHTVDELLDFLGDSVKNAVVVFDEFQQIKEYPEKRFDALLRTHVQKMDNIRFVFSGSERRMLSHMFRSSSEPFYRSATDIELGRIPKEKYLDYVTSMFDKFEKTIDLESVSQLYDLFSGYTSYMSQVMNKAFYLTSQGSLCDQDIIMKGLSECLVGAENGYYDVFFRLSAPKRAFLKGLSVSRGVLHVTGKKFIDTFGLNTSSAQECAKSLQGKGLADRFIYRDPRTGVYYIDDKFLEVWIRAKEGISLRSQLEEAPRFVMRDPRENMRRNFPQPYSLTPEQNKELSKLGYLTEPVEFTDVDLSVTRYVVQKDTNGDIISLPVDDCLRLLGGVDFVIVNKKRHDLSDNDKRILSEGKTLDINGAKFRFELKNCLVKRKYHHRENEPKM